VSNLNLVTAVYEGRPAQSPALSTADGQSLSTAELLNKIGKYAAALLSLGIKPGDRVSFKLEKHLETLFLAHACLSVGAIIHPLNPTYTFTETEYLLRDVEPVLFVCPPEAAADYAGSERPTPSFLIETLGAGSIGSFGELARQSAPTTVPAVGRHDEVAALLYTSGTTGKPKGACITHSNLVESARALTGVWQVRASDALLHALPIYHAHGLLTAINTALIGGGSIHFLSRFDVREVLAAIPRTTFIMGVPTFYARLLREPALKSVIHERFRLAISGSAPLGSDIAMEFSQRTGVPLIERYGATETAIVTAVPPEAADRLGWVGWPLPGVEIRIQTDDGLTASRNATGMLQTRGHNVFAGYWRCPEADKEAFTEDGWFITGDLAEVDGKGCVRLLGRSSDLVISGGMNVYPREVEGVLDSLRDIAESAVFGVPHPDFGEAVVAAVERLGGEDFDEAAIIAMLRSRLAPYKVPKRILVVEEIPRNPLGKVLKSDLRASYCNLFDQLAH
jgi:malonyl-CoA/methylmalonyl-CoA synthetase